MRINSIRISDTLLSLILSFFLSANCQCKINPEQTMKSPDTLQNRQPAVAGRFYPSDSAGLQQTLKKLFNNTSEPVSNKEILAIISPHAGYVFSGEVAAAAFSQLDSQKEYKTVFIIGSSHQNSFPGASVYSIGNYITPFGVLETDFEVAQNLVKENKILAYDPHYQIPEHCIEVQLPFLQFRLKKGFKIVPILLGTHDKRACEKIAEALEPYFTNENLFIISTDFAHYPAYNEAVKSDKIIANALISNKPEVFLQAVESFSENKIPNLSTGCCSWPSVITLLNLTANLPGITYNQVMYKNSGDSDYGDKANVVGYWAISVSRLKKNKMVLDEPEKTELLKIARKTIEEYLFRKHAQEVPSNTFSMALCSKSGAFVTLKKQGELRGCIGQFESEDPLYKLIQQLAIASATKDYRFSPVTSRELDSIHIEISVLTPLQKITDVNEIRLGTDGIYIKKGSRNGTFLPQVATDTGWSLEEFLGHCSRDKAGIGWDGWKEKDVEIFTFQAIIFGEKE